MLLLAWILAADVSPPPQRPAVGQIVRLKGGGVCVVVRNGACASGLRLEVRRGDRSVGTVELDALLAEAGEIRLYVWRVRPAGSTRLDDLREGDRVAPAR